MGFKKFNKSEKSSVLPSKQLGVIEKTLRRAGKTSVSDLTDEERIKLSESLDK